ncbi:MAG: hypothetical protein O3C13_09445 [Bacteroidetes bacterium]|nr:hypothetical protein [Bacteroidota bacterium]
MPTHFLRPSLFFHIFLLLGFFSSCESDQLSEETTDMVKVTIQITGFGEVTPNLSSFPINSEVTFKAIPSEGYYFDRWEGT